MCAISIVCSYDRRRNKYFFLFLVTFSWMTVLFCFPFFPPRSAVIKRVCSKNSSSPSNHKIGNDVQILLKLGFAASAFYRGGFCLKCSWIYHSTPLWYLLVACPPCLRPTLFAAADLSFPASGQLTLQILQNSPPKSRGEPGEPQSSRSGPSFECQHVSRRTM